MRSAVGIFGLACGAIIVLLVGRYGYKTADLEFDAWITAFYFAMIATAGLGGHAVAARLYGLNRAIALAAGIISCVALMLNLGNSLGAIAGRQDKTTLDRVAKNREIRATEAEVKRLTELRRDMAPFAATDTDAVAATKRAAEAATIAKERECGGGDPKKRGPLCRDKEEAEAAAMKTWREAAAAKAMTDRAEGLEADAKTQRDKLVQLGPIVTVNTQGSAMAKLFRLPDTEADFASTAQQFGMAAIAELIIAICLVSWEILGRASASQATPVTRVSRQAPTIDAELVEGDPGRFLPTALRPGGDVSEEDVYRAYEAWCAGNGCAPMPWTKFKGAFAALCDHCGFKRSRGKVFGLQLATTQSKSAPRLGKMLTIRRS